MTTPATVNQVPDHAILDYFNKQSYLGNRFGYAMDTTLITVVTEKPLILLRNPVVTGAAFPVKNQGLFCDLRKVTVLTAAQTAILKFYINPTVTAAGTVQTPVNLRPAYATASIASLSINPTTTANGTLVGSVTASAFASGAASNLLILDPGYSLLITVTASSTSTNISTETSWYEL